MSGFDPSRFLGEEPSRPEPAPRDDAHRSLHQAAAGAARVEVSPPVAMPATVPGDMSFDPETGEFWENPEPARQSVATVATVATLPDDVPFAAQLNAMFFYPCPDHMSGSQWRELCLDARRFAEEKCADALACGWEAIELFGCTDKPWGRRYGVRPLCVDGLVMLLDGRTVGRVEAHAIEILNRVGAHNRLYRAHHMTARHSAALMWDAFHPANVAPQDVISTRDMGLISRSEYERLKRRPSG